MTDRFPSSHSWLRPVRLDPEMRRRQRLLVGGVPLVPQGFAWPVEERDLHVQCAELNRQALMPSPETLVGKSVREIFGRRRD